MSDSVSPILRPVSQAELDEVIKRHGMFMTMRKGGARAVLDNTNLSGLNLSGHNLSQAQFYGACLHHANLD